MARNKCYPITCGTPKNVLLGCNKCFTFWSISVIEITWLCGLAYDPIGVFLENDAVWKTMLSEGASATLVVDNLK